MSATRPAIVFSIGIMARSALPVSTALKASSKVAQGSGCMSGNMLRQAVSELAPGSPWKEMRLVGDGDMFRPSGKQFAGAFEIFGRVDAERHGGDDFGVDAHAGLQRAQLLEAFARFQRRGL